MIDSLPAFRFQFELNDGTLYVISPVIMHRSRDGNRFWENLKQSTISLATDIAIDWIDAHVEISDYVDTHMKEIRAWGHANGETMAVKTHISEVEMASMAGHPPSVLEDFVADTTQRMVRELASATVRHCQYEADVITVPSTGPPSMYYGFLPPF